MNEILSVPPLQNIGEEMPVGMIHPYIGLGDAPDGWLDCDGSAINRNQYRDLFNLIGTTYGEGDGSTTFNLPNFNGKFLEGNATPGTVKEAGLPNIIGQGVSNVACGTTEAANKVFKSGCVSLTTYPQTHGGTGSMRMCTLRINASDSNAIYGKSATVQPPAVTVRYLVKY